MRQMKNRVVGMCATAAMLSLTAGVSAQVSASRTSGHNLNLDPSDPIDVPFNFNAFRYELQVDLIFDPTAGPMEKHFLTPDITLDASQPIPLAIREDYLILPDGESVSDWHEEILTDGWVWTNLPNDPVVITRDGEPWEILDIPTPPTGDPTRQIWVEFDRIDPGHVLDIHKAYVVDRYPRQPDLGRRDRRV